MYEFDDSRWPLVVMRMQEQATTAMIERMRDDLYELVERREPFALLFDITGVELPPRKDVLEVLRWTRDLRDRYTRYYEDVSPRIPTFTAYHMPSRVGNLLRFILQMMPSLRSQYIVCASVDEGMIACEEAIVRLDLSQSASRRAG